MVLIGEDYFALSLSLFFYCLELFTFVRLFLQQTAIFDHVCIDKSIFI